MAAVISSYAGLQTRFAGLPKWVAIAILAALFGLIALGFTRDVPVMSAGAGPVGPGKSDMALYRSIAERVGAGESYYAVAVAEHRASHFPLHPFVTMRLPTLAEISGHLGPFATGVFLYAIVLAAWLVVRTRLEKALPEKLALAASAALAVGLVACLVPQAALFHESWAAALIVLSLGCRSREHWVASVVFGLMACAVRELALPYLCVMAAAALIDGTRREVGGWIAAIVMFALILCAHAAAVSSVVTAHDLASPGWNAVGGWPFILKIARYSPLLAEAPSAIVAVIVPFALLGWIAWRDAIGFRGALTTCGYTAAFMLIGRPDNDYWGLMLAPLLLVGLVFAPFALRDLARTIQYPTPRHIQPSAAG